MRAIVIGSLACLLCACATGPSEHGLWKIERKEDRIVGQESAIAYLETRSRNSEVERDQPGLFQAVALQLVCFDYAPVVRIAFNHRVGSNRSTTVHYRFDENPGREANARILQNFRTVIIEDKESVRSFVNELRSSARLHVRVVSHLGGTTTADFRVHGAADAIDTAYARCPLDGSQKPRMTGASAADSPRDSARVSN